MSKYSPLFARFFFFLRRSEQKRVSFLRRKGGEKNIYVSGREMFYKKEKNNMNTRTEAKNLVLNPVCSNTHCKYQVLEKIQSKLSFPSFSKFDFLEKYYSLFLTDP